MAGIRACLKKGLAEVIASYDADIYCFQEVKATLDQFMWPVKGYQIYLNAADKAGYSGTLVATKRIPRDACAGFGDEDLQTEGRTVVLEYQNFYLICCYTPNSQELLKRLKYRLRWEEQLRGFLQRLDGNKAVIYCGDLNVAHTPIDLANPHANHYSPGFSDEEREAFSQLLSLGFVDTWRQLHPDIKDTYSFWSYRGGARDRNVGWRLDYFVLSQRLLPKVRRCEILTDVYGSDHCPILLDIDL